MELSKKQIKIARTKKGSPCLWESYVKFTDLKRATIITDGDGIIKNSIFVRKNSDKQSLIPIKEGDFIVKIFEDDDGISKSIFKIEHISNMSNHADVMLVYRVGPNIETTEFNELKLFTNSIKSAEMKIENSEYIASELFESTELHVD